MHNAEKTASQAATASAKSAPGASVTKAQRAKRDAAQSTRRPNPGSVNILKAENLSAMPWLVHGFSTRQGGVTPEYGGSALNLGLTAEDTPKNVEHNRELFLQALGTVENGNSWPIVTVKQIHSAIIYHVTEPTPQMLKGDGLITDTPGILLGVKTADCLPVIIADPVHRAVGVFHAGWRGTVQRIVEKGVGEMQRRFGSNPAELQAAIGPGIGVCCYEIGEEVEREFDSQFAYWKELFEDVFDSWSLNARYPLLFLNQRAPGHGDPALSRHLNIPKANLLQLRAAGVPQENITSLDLCTSCRTDLFFSYRKEHVTGRMLNVVGIKE